MVDMVEVQRHHFYILFALNHIIIIQSTYVVYIYSSIIL